MGNPASLGYSEMTLVSVPARKTYIEPVRPIRESRPALTAQQQMDNMLNIAEVTGKRNITTRLIPNMVISEEDSIAALEVMSRFAVNPKWLIYLPSTMTPSKTSQLPDLLEHPAEVFDHCRREGVERVVCEEKHMGSRAILIICRDADAATRRFRVIGEGIGICYTRTERRFIDNHTLKAAFLARMSDAITAIELWDEL